MTQPQMQIRQLVEADAEAYYQVRLRALREEPQAFGTSYEEGLARPLSEMAERFRSQSASSDNFTLGAFEGERLVGMVSFWRPAAVKFHHCGDIAAMYVVPEARGRGIGRALLMEALARARAQKGLEQVHLAVTSANPTARALYTAVGFRTYGILPRSFKVGDTYLDEDLMLLEFSQL